MSTRYSRFAVILALGLGVFLFGVKVHGGQAVADEAGLPGQPGVSASSSSTPTPTPPLPPGQAILSQGQATSAGKGSVSEHGLIHSTNNRVSDSQKFWAGVSWKRHLYRDHYHFRKPANLTRQIRNVRTIRRVVVGRWISVRAHHRWYCARRSSTEKNSAYWSPPSFSVNHIRTVGTSQIDGHSMWDVRGDFVQTGRSYQSRLVTDVFVDQNTQLIRRATERGVVRHYGLGKSKIRGRENFTDYGKHIHARVPPQCRS